jgi:hypothetical protein
MKERIKELSEQARHWAHFEGLEQNLGSSPDILFEQKFAQLIVAECVEICDNTTGTSYLNGWYAGKQIRKHFGVEE